MWLSKHIRCVFLLTWVLLTLIVCCVQAQSSSRCKLKRYTHKAVQTDLNGQRCWDDVKIKSCWGYCLSYEVRTGLQEYLKIYCFLKLNIFSYKVRLN